MNFLTEAFKALDVLNEDTFKADEQGLEELKDFIGDDKGDDVVSIIDIDAEDEEEVKDSYIGKVILCCNVCKSNIYKDKKDVVVDEDTELANVDEECPYCHTVDGFMVVGMVAPFEEAKVETDGDDEDIEVKVDGEEVEVKEDEALTEAVGSRLEKAVKRIIRNAPNATLREIKRMFYNDPNTSGLYGVDSEIEKIYRKFYGIEEDEALTEAKKSEDDIDAIRDDRVERAKRRFTRVRDDADSRRDYMKKHDMKECGDMKNEACSRKRKKRVDESVDGDFFEIDGFDSHIDEEFEDDGYTGYYVTYSKNGVDIVTVEIWNDNFTTPISVINSPYSPHLFNHYYESFESFVNDLNYKYDRYINKNESLHEDFSEVEVTTAGESKQRIKVTSEEVEGEETIVPVSDEVEDEIMMDSEEETTEEEPVEEEPVEETEEETTEEEGIVEESLNSLCSKYLKENYSNVKSFRLTNALTDGKKLKLEGVIKFASGNDKKTSFLFEKKETGRNGKVKLLGENLQICKGKKAFVLNARMRGNKLLGESLSYNYMTKNNEGKSQRVSGTVSNKRG